MIATIECPQDAYTFFGLDQAASKEDIDLAYSQTISNYPRGLLNPEVRNAYEAWSFLVDQSRDARKGIVWGSPDSNVSASQAPVRSEQHSFQGPRDSGTHALKSAQGASIEDDALRNLSESLMQRYNDKRDKDEQGSIEQRLHNEKEKRGRARYDELPNGTLIAAATVPVNSTDQTTQPSRRKSEGRSTLQANREANITPTPAPTESSDSKARSTQNRPTIEDSATPCKQSGQFHNFWRWTHQRYGWSMGGMANPQEQSMDNKLLVFLSIWLKECGVGTYQPTKPIDRAFLRLLVLACSQDDVTATLAKRFRDAFELMDSDLALRFVYGVRPKQASTLATLVLALQQSHTSYDRSALSHASAEKLCLKLKAVAAELPPFVQRPPDAAHFASERMLESLLSLGSLPQSAGANSTVIRTQPVSSWPIRSSPLPTSRPNVDQKKVEVKALKSMKPWFRHVRDTTSSAGNGESKQTSIKPSGTADRRAASADVNRTYSTSKFAAARQPRSLRSKASSTNISLRDGRRSSFDQSYQKPEFSTGRGRPASTLYDIPKDKSSLPPAPGVQPKAKAAESEASDLPLQPQPTNSKEKQCYICSKRIKFHRKKDWQRHVLEDVKPYQCFEETCHSWTTTYSSLKELRTHYKKAHPKDEIFQGYATYKCPFCQEILFLSVKEHFAHIGRHLEGIAFSVVNHQYEEWDFYSDAGSDATNAPDAPQTDLFKKRWGAKMVSLVSLPAAGVASTAARQMKQALPARSTIVEKRGTHQSKDELPTRRTSSLVSLGRKIFGNRSASAKPT